MYWKIAGQSMQCRECKKAIADDTTFCPYCGTKVERRQQKRRQRKRRQNGGDRPHPHRHVPKPLVIVVVVVVVFVGFVAVFGGGGSRGSSGGSNYASSAGGTAAPSELPELFEGHIQYVIEDLVAIDLVVQDGWAILSMDDTVGGVNEFIAGVFPDSVEMGSGVYDYELAHVDLNETSYSMEEFPSAAEALIGDVPTRAQCIDALTSARAQVIVPTGALRGGVSGTWGVRFEQGGLPMLNALLPEDDVPIYTELLLTINEDGTFVLSSVARLAPDEYSGLEDAPEVEYTVTGTWQGRNAGDLTFQAETLRVARDGVPESESSLIGMIPPMYVGVSVSAASDPASGGTPSTEEVGEQSEVGISATWRVPKTG